MKPRYGAVGKHGSIAVLERFWRSLKSEMLRRLGLVPMAMPRMADEVAAYVEWYDRHRPHQGLGGRTPREVRRDEEAARERARVEPRARFPLARGDPRQTQRRVTRLVLDAPLVRGRAHLPIIDVRETV